MENKNVTRIFALVLRENLLKEGKLLDDTTRLQARAMSQLNEHVT